jgi:hypothetical protein
MFLYVNTYPLYTFYASQYEFFPFSILLKKNEKKNKTKFSQYTPLHRMMNAVREREKKNFFFMPT